MNKRWIPWLPVILLAGLLMLRFAPNGSDLGRSFHSGWQ